MNDGNIRVAEVTPFAPTVDWSDTVNYRPGEGIYR